MTARLTVCVLFLSAWTLSPMATGAETSPAAIGGTEVVTAAFSNIQSSPEPGEAADLPTAEPSDPTSIESLTADCDLSSCDGCGPRLSPVWTEEDFFHVGQFFVQGWLDQGFTWNPADPASRFNGPLTFNDRSNEYQMNQLYVAMGRRVNSDGCKFDFGGRVDLLYGTDYFFTTARGLETWSSGAQRWNTTGPRAGGTAALYGLAMPQLYAEFYMPWRYGMTLKVGHFNTILGYESVMAPKNFFYSHSYTMQYGEPKTHTGFLTSYRFGKRLTLHAGMTRGWDTWEDPADRVGFLGGISWTSATGRTNVNLSVCTGDENVVAESNRTVYSLVLMHELSSRWHYVFQNDFGIQDNAFLDNQFNIVPARWYSINQYLYYTMSDTLSLGFRFEWFRDEANYRVLGVPIAVAVSGKNYYEATLGLNWRPNARVTVRPEVRWDWSDVTPRGGNGMYDDFTKKNQFTFATDMIWMF